MYKHIPVLINEILNGVYIPNNGTILDGTLGLGGHAYEILNSNKNIKAYYGFDVDSSAIKLAKEKLAQFPCVHYINTNYTEAVNVLKQQGVNSIDTILLDLGVSSMQLDDPDRGFSFRFDAPLNMRLDGMGFDTVKDYINTVDEMELVDVLLELGEESFAKRIAMKIVEARNIKPIETTFELRDIVYKAYPKVKRFSRVHPATKTFQALRIAINSELSSLTNALDVLPTLLSKNGRILVISFHSLEDRIVKQKFRSLTETDQYKLINKKPIIPSKDEVTDNPRSRSSKLRIIEKIYV